MSFWIVASLLTLAMVGLLARPLLRRSFDQGLQPADVYKAQLAELDAEEASGLILASDAKSARAEIARRLLRSSEKEQTGSVQTLRDPRLLIAGLSIVILATSIGGYLWLGRPDLPAQPFSSRDTTAESADRLGPAAQELERRLIEIEDPVDRALFLADALASIGAFPEALEAYANVLSMRAEDADALTRIGEIQLAQANGIVSAEIATWFDRALVTEPNKPRATYYRALYDYQRGNFVEAESRLTRLLETATEDAIWVSQVSGLRNEARAGLELPSGAQDVLALDDEARSARIREMVAGLAARLEENPDDFEGWLRLATAYAVMDQREDAAMALLRASVLATGESVLEARVAEIAADHDLLVP